MATMSSAARTLASRSRVAILHHLQGVAGPAPVVEIAQAVGLHVNTAREHLDRLVATGFVASAAEPRTTRGRPRMLYRSVDRPAAATVDPRVREQLERLLLAGYRGGPAAGPETPPTHHQLAALETHFEDLGFDPEADVGRLEVHLRRCPVVELARENTDVVCSVHLTLTQGVLDRVVGPLAADRLEPFVGPQHCVLHLRRA